MTDDDRHPVILDTGAPPSPDYALEVAEAIAEGVRVLNHQTRHHEALEDPYDGDRLIRRLDSAVHRLPQLLDQIASWYEREAAEGKLEVRRRRPECPYGRRRDTDAGRRCAGKR